MMYSEWMVKQKTGEGKYGQYQLYRIEIGGNFTDKEEAEHIAYELNKEASGELDK